MHTLPPELPLLPLANLVIFPQTVTPLAVSQETAVRLADAADSTRSPVVMATLRPRRSHTHPDPADCYAVGVAALVHRLVRLPDGTLRVAVEGLERVRIEELVSSEPFAHVRITPLPDESADQARLDALAGDLRGIVQSLAARLPISAELLVQIADEPDAARLSYLVAQSLLPAASLAERQGLLEQRSPRTRLELIVARLSQQRARIEERSEAAVSQPLAAPGLAPELLAAAVIGHTTVQARLLDLLGADALRQARGGLARPRPLPGLCGPPGSGRRTLAAALARAGERPFHMIDLDDPRARQVMPGVRPEFTPGSVVLLAGLEATRDADLLSTVLDLLDAPGNMVLLATLTNPEHLPGVLRRRVELLELAGTTPAEQQALVRDLLLPAQAAAGGLARGDLVIDDAALRVLVARHGCGYRLAELEQRVVVVCRRAAAQLVAGATAPILIDPAFIEAALGPVTDTTFSAAAHRPGAALGVCWRPEGASGTFVSVLRDTTREQGSLPAVIGAQGPLAVDVAARAQHWARVAAGQSGIAPEDANLHGLVIALQAAGGRIPEHEAAPLGLPIAAALLALLRGQPLPAGLALTGDLTLHGDVLPVSHARARAIAALHAGATTLALPHANLAEVADLQDEIRLLPLVHAGELPLDG